jgi:subtilisin family serine protease
MHARSVLVASMLSALAVGTSLGATPSTDTDWRAQWRSDRNALVERNPRLAYDPTSLLVKFHPGATKEAVNAVKAAAGVVAEPIETWKLLPGVEHLAVEQGVRVEDALKSFLASPAVEYAEPDHIGHLHASPNDTHYNLLWGMNNTGQTIGGVAGVANADIDADLAWNTTTGSASVVVGMADSGIRRTHEDLAANIWTNPGEVAGNNVDDDGNGRVDDTWGWDFYNNDKDPSDDNGHGTHTAGTVGAVGNNAKGVAGVCWTVRLAGLKIGSRNGSVSTTAAISAVDYCVGKGIRVANHSWGGPVFNTTLNNAITNASTAGHMLVCSAGNGGTDQIGDNNDAVPQYPSNYSQDNIVSVAAIDNRNLLATFSNFGATTVDIGAPGVNTASCGRQNNSNYVYMSGTSMAAPHVTGVCALVLARNPTWTYQQVRSRVLTTAKPVGALNGKCVTGGCVNANNAVQ